MAEPCFRAFTNNLGVGTALIVFDTHTDVPDAEDRHLICMSGREYVNWYWNLKSLRFKYSYNINGFDINQERVFETKPSFPFSAKIRGDPNFIYEGKIPYDEEIGVHTEFELILQQARFPNLPSDPNNERTSFRDKLAAENQHVICKYEKIDLDKNYYLVLDFRETSDCFILYTFAVYPLWKGPGFRKIMDTRAIPFMQGNLTLNLMSYKEEEVDSAVINYFEITPEFFTYEELKN